MGTRQRIEARAIKQAEQRQRLNHCMEELSKDISQVAEEHLPCAHPLMQIEQVLKLLLKDKYG